MNINEVARYLGYHSAQIDERTREMIGACAEKLDKAAAPKHVFGIFPITVTQDAVGFPAFTIKSRALAKHVALCDEAALFAATLGAQADRLMTQTAYRNIGDAAVLQACAAVLIEEYCDACAGEIEAKAKGKYLKPRFSPGYGDFPLSHQRDILSALFADKRIGLYTTDGLMLTPTKSVTAVIGIAAEQSGCNIQKCALCKSEGCVFRKE